MISIIGKSAVDVTIYAFTYFVQAKTQVVPERKDVRAEVLQGLTRRRREKQKEKAIDCEGLM